MPGSDNEFDDISSHDDSSDEEEVLDKEEEEQEQEQEQDQEDQDQEQEDQEDQDQEEQDQEEDDSDDESNLNQKMQKTAGDAQLGGTNEDQEEEEDEENNDAYLQKFNADINRQYLTDYHPEAMINNYQEINNLTIVVRDNNNNIIDKLHRTLPYLTKYERARVLGQRAKQINSGAKAFVRVPENVIDGYLIAELELAQKRIPFIIRRPIPGGACEYWKLKDLEIIGF